MNLLANSRVYLCGPVEHDPAAKGWRNIITEKLAKYNVQIYDPLVKPTWLPSICKVDPPLYRKVLSGESNQLKTSDVYDANAHIRRICLRLVSSADWIICWLPKLFTSGTWEELYLAAHLEKPVLFCIPDGVPATWILPIFANDTTFNDVFFKNWDELLNHVDKLSNGTTIMDPYKWISVCYKRTDL